MTSETKLYTTFYIRYVQKKKHHTIRGTPEYMNTNVCDKWRNEKKNYFIFRFKKGNIKLHYPPRGTKTISDVSPIIPFARKTRSRPLICISKLPVI